MAIGLFTRPRPIVMYIYSFFEELLPYLLGKVPAVCQLHFSTNCSSNVSVVCSIVIVPGK